MRINNKPVGNLHILKIIDVVDKKSNRGFGFEADITKIDIVRTINHVYIRRQHYVCSAEANGRPLAILEEEYFKISTRDDTITKDNWKEYVNLWSPDYGSTKYFDSPVHLIKGMERIFE